MPSDPPLYEPEDPLQPQVLCDLELHLSRHIALSEQLTPYAYAIADESQSEISQSGL